MSRDRGSLNFDIGENLTTSEWRNLLKILDEKGWKYRSPKPEKVILAPLNSDDIDWNGVALSDQQIEEIIAEKQKTNRAFSIRIYYENSTKNPPLDDIILHQNDKTLSIWLGDCSKEIEGHLIIDYNHYLLIFMPLIYQIRKSFHLTVSAYVDRI